MRYYKHLYLTEGLEKKKEKIIRKLEAGRSLCAEHGSEYPLFQGGTDSLVQYSFGKRNCICRSDLICRNSGSISGKTCTSYIETFGSDTRNICWWSGILYDL